MYRIVITAAALLLTGGVARAQAADCIPNAFDIDTAMLARVKGPGNTAFLHGEEITGCPAQTAACRERAYLVPGDLVVVRGVGSGLACVDYTDDRGRSHRNWVARTAIDPVRPTPVALASWTGTWRRPETIIRVRAGKGAGHLNLVGQSTYGASDPARAAIGAINVGDIAADVVPRNDRAAFGMGNVGDRGAIEIKDLGGNSTAFIPYAAVGPDECGVRVRRLGPYLLVRDNNRCGGLNVSFSGVYRTRGR